MLITFMLMVWGLKWPDFNNEVIYAINAISIYESHLTQRYWWLANAKTSDCWRGAMHVLLQRKQISLMGDRHRGRGNSGHVMWAAALSCKSFGSEVEHESKLSLWTVKWVCYFTNYRVNLHRTCIHDKEHLYVCWSGVICWKETGEPRKEQMKE